MRLMRAGVRRSRKQMQTLQGLFDQRQRLYFLHIGKTAGTQIAGLSDKINQTNENWRIQPCPHGKRLQGLPADCAYFFSIRRPETRFRSSFYSRKRKGQPRNHFEWSASEALAFAQFEHANDLAEALFLEGAVGRHAFFAMKSITHTSRAQVEWFDQAGYFLDQHPPVWIIRQEIFEADFTRLLEKIGHKEDVQPSRDRTKAHANDYSGIPDLSDLARANLKRWYAQDYLLYDYCLDWLAAQTQRETP
ncbi:MAG: hypothetical protein AAGA97_02095 [Pseudomonadota bacterium]